MEVGPRMYTFKGHPKRMFKVVDAAGSWIPCVGYGEHASREGLDSTEVCIFFAKARRAPKNIGAVMQLHDERR